MGEASQDNRFTPVEEDAWIMDESGHEFMLRIFRDMPDPRVDRTRDHSLHDILVIAVCAVLAGLEHWTQIADYGQANQEWFGTFLDLPNGIPSHDTFGRVFAALDPDEFEKRLQRWVHAVAGSSAGKHIAIDGKTLRRSFDRASQKAAIHMVNAYVHENHAVFAQVKVDEKSNEITAVPKLLAMLQVKDATVTFDALHCQKTISEKVVDKGGHYVMVLKGNQPTLQADVQWALADARDRGWPGEHDTYACTEKGHGRIERRRCWTLGDVTWLQERHGWPGLQSVALIERERTVEGRTSREECLVISSLPGRCAQRIAQVVRNHWRVENELHWTLDVAFNEDACRIRVENAAENLSRVRRIGLMLLKQEKTAKMGIKSKRAKCGYQREYLFKVLGIA